MFETDLIKRAGNEATSVNPAIGVDLKMTEHGSDWLWAVFSVFGLVSLIYAVLFVVYEHRGTTIHRYAVAGPLSISLVLAFSYFTMASNLGWTAVQAEFNNLTTPNQSEVPGIRQIFYAKYVAWFLTWPVLLYLTELTGVVTRDSSSIMGPRPWSFFDLAHGLFLQICGSLFFIIGLLVGSLIQSSYKWGYWTMAAFAQLLVTYLIFKHQLVDLTISGIKLVLLVFTHVCIYLYLVAWGLSDGGNVITVDSAHVFFGVLDLLIFVVVPALLVATATSSGVMPTFFSRHNGNSDLEKQAASDEAIRQSGETAVPSTTVAPRTNNIGIATQEPVAA